MACRYYNVRIVGLPAATCNGILRRTSLHVVRTLGECVYRIRTSHFYETEVRELIEQCAGEEGYAVAIVEVDAKRPSARKEATDFPAYAFSTP